MSEALKELRDLMMGEKEKLASYEGAAGEREQTDCKRCAGNGEIVTDWDRYLGAPQPGDQGDEGTADCPDCDGIGKVDVEDAHPSPPPAADADRVRIAVEALEYYAGPHAMPNDGPWGASSDDYGRRAAEAIAALKLGHGK